MDNLENSEVALPPTVKRVVNIKCLRFNSINNNFETRSKPLPTNLSKINYSLKDNLPNKNTIDENNEPKVRFEHTPLLRQTSELDLGDHFQINKTNPIFQNEEKKPTHSNQSNVYENSRNSTFANEFNSILPKDDHIYEELYVHVDRKKGVVDNQEAQLDSDFKVKIKIGDDDIPPRKNLNDKTADDNISENEPIYIDPADYAMPTIKPVITNNIKYQNQISIITLTSSDSSFSNGVPNRQPTVVSDNIYSRISFKNNSNDSEHDSKVSGNSSSFFNNISNLSKTTDESSLSDEISFHANFINPRESIQSTMSLLTHRKESELIENVRSKILFIRMSINISLFFVETAFKNGNEPVVY